MPEFDTDRGEDEIVIRECMVENVDKDEENGQTLRKYPPVNNIFEVHDDNGNVLRLNTSYDVDKTSKHENDTRDTRLGVNSDMKRFS